MWKKGPDWLWSVGLPFREKKIDHAWFSLSHSIQGNNLRGKIPFFDFADHHEEDLPRKFMSSLLNPYKILQCLKCWNARFSFDKSEVILVLRILHKWKLKNYWDCCDVVEIGQDFLGVVYAMIFLNFLLISILDTIVDPTQINWV